MFRGRVRQIHFVGVGGIGMSGLAEIVHALGFDASGSDLRPNSTTERLKALGVKIHIGHRASNIKGSDVVVYSSAIKPDNPELVEALQGGIPVIARAELLAELMRVKYGVAVAGSHGKTTTTSLVATVLRAAGFDPTVAVGGKMAALGSNAKLGAGDLMVAEADESDGSFLLLTPTIAVVTNIDPEHLDYWGSHERIKEAFIQFLSRVPFYGLAVLCLDHPHVQSILPAVRRRHTTYGFSPQADYRAKNIESNGLETSFDVLKHGELLAPFCVRMPGRHNVLNTLATIAVADELEVPIDVIQSSLSDFDGVARRFTVIGKVEGVTLIDDYGHHPAEIKATLEAARAGFDKRIVVVFQPHRYSRTRDLFEQFVTSFNLADIVVVTDIYPAGEAPIAGVSAELVAKALKEHGHQRVHYVGDKDQLPDFLQRMVVEGDVVIAQGAGDINQSIRELGKRLESQSEARSNLSRQEVS
ncbi:MAG: UDP-N-acetylmuramate--L-alanine ligase [Sorangium cellulosum]|nr:MAG: UDP-N-acetylmuramate--L-alanine ligase [Sorangium cellulosum]